MAILLFSCEGFQEDIISVNITVEDVPTVVVINGEIEKDSSVWVQISYSEDIHALAGTPVNYEENLISYLKKSEVPIIGVENDDDSVSIDNWHPPENCFIVLGNESYGISSEIRNLCMEKVKIPMFGFKGSMNVHHALVCAARKIVEYNSGIS